MEVSRLQALSRLLDGAREQAKARECRSQVGRLVGGFSLENLHVPQEQEELGNDQHLEFYLF